MRNHSQDSSSSMSAPFREDNRCVEKKVLAEKTEWAAKFNINYLDENQVSVLDTDYENYLFFCVENTDAPGESLACQCLTRTLTADNQVMEKFNKVLQTLPVHVRLFFDPTQVEAALPARPGHVHGWGPSRGPQLPSVGPRPLCGNGWDLACLPLTVGAGLAMLVKCPALS
ncbi:beta-lactoglobulin-1-like [Crocuta crocuta]